MRKLNHAALALLCGPQHLAGHAGGAAEPGLDPPSAAWTGTPEQRRIQLDVVVTDAKGQPVSGLTQQDFKLFDNKLPQPIVAFQAFDGATQKPDPPVQVILVLDTVNVDFNEVAFVRQSMERFLCTKRQSSGHSGIDLSI